MLPRHHRRSTLLPPPPPAKSPTVMLIVQISIFYALESIMALPENIYTPAPWNECTHTFGRTSWRTMGDAANHYLSLVISALDRHADALVFRPYLGRNDDWGRVTYRELEHRLSVTRAYWLRTLGPLQLNPCDVVGFWSVLDFYLSSDADDN